MVDDIADVTAWRNCFPITNQCVYLDHAFVGPLSAHAVDAVDSASTSHAECGSLAFERLMEHCDVSRGDIAAFIGALREEIAFVGTTSLAMSVVANALPWRAGDSVVVPAIEYPSNVLPWHALGAQGVGVRQVPCPDGRVTVDAILETCDTRTRVVAVSWIQFSNGYRVDLERLGDACRQRGILLVVDGNHAAGMLHINIGELPVDILATQSFKWLLGPFHAGWMYVRRELIETLMPTAAGPLSVDTEASFLDPSLNFRADAGRFETGVLNISGIAGASASMRLLSQIGMRTVEDRVLWLADRLDEGLRHKGYTIAGDRRTEAGRSGILAFRQERPDAHALRPGIADQRYDRPDRSKGLDRRSGDEWHHGLLRQLLAEEFVVSLREGYIRVSPHFYNTEDEVDAFVATVP